MKKFILGLILGLILGATFTVIAAGTWDVHMLAGGLYNNTEGIPLKVNSDGYLEVRQ